MATTPRGPGGNSLGGADYDETKCLPIDTTLERGEKVVWALQESNGLLYYATTAVDTIWAFGDSSWIMPPPDTAELDSSPGWQWIISDSIINDSTVLHRSTFGPAAACKVNL